MSRKNRSTILSQDAEEKELHLIADNYATHKHPVVQEWLTKHPRIHMHFHRLRSQTRLFAVPRA